MLSSPRASRWTLATARVSLVLLLLANLGRCIPAAWPSCDEACSAAAAAMLGGTSTGVVGRDERLTSGSAGRSAIMKRRSPHSLALLSHKSEAKEVTVHVQ